MSKDHHVLSSALIGRKPDDHIQAEYRQEMNVLASALDEMFNEPGKTKTIAFALLVAPFGDGERVNYISNAERSDMLDMMQAYLKRNGR